MSDDRVRRLTELLDRQLGTPCEQIRHQQQLEAQRNVVIEECARRIGRMAAYSAEEISFKKDVTAAIRAMKDKP